MNKYKIIFFLFAFISLSTSQINTESIRKNNSSEGIFNTINIDFDYDNADNNEIFNINFGYRLDFIQSGFNTFMKLNYENGYNKTDGATNTIEDKGFCHIRYTKDIKSKILFLETFAQYEFNDFLNIESRYLAGIGARMKFSLKNFNAIFLGIGVMNEKETYSNDPDENLIRSTNYLSNTTKINNNISLTTIIYLQLDIEDVDDYRILYDGSINVKALENLSLNFAINYKYDNDPHENFSESYTQLSSGIEYEF